MARTSEDARIDAQAIDRANGSTALSRTAVRVRWRDLDAYNHVNNSTYLTYLEEARLEWMQHIPDGWRSKHAAPVVAASQLNYRAPINWPATLTVTLRVERLGTSSITIGHRIVDSDNPDRLYCDGHVVLVWIDPATGKPVPLPDVVRTNAT